MTKTIEMLYHYWIGAPRPERWPEFAAKDPLLAHGLDCFQEGFRLGLLLGLEALFTETED